MDRLVPDELRQVTSRQAATVSERLFRAFCHRHDVSCRRVRRSAITTPDFRIKVQAYPSVVEIKQFDPNREDREALRALNAGEVRVRSHNPGRRVAKAIQHAYTQIASLARGRCPGILVIYNNVEHEPTHTDPMMIRIAMYGQITVPVLVPANPSIRPQFLAPKWGGKKSVSQTHNRALSAVGVLYRTVAGDIGLTFYHNIFATHQFNPDWFRVPDVKHYTVTDAVTFSDWVEV